MSTVAVATTAVHRAIHERIGTTASEPNRATTTHTHRSTRVRCSMLQSRPKALPQVIYRLNRANLADRPGGRSREGIHRAKRGNSGLPVKIGERTIHGTIGANISGTSRAEDASACRRRRLRSPAARVGSEIATHVSPK